MQKLVDDIVQEAVATIQSRLGKMVVPAAAKPSTGAALPRAHL